MVCAFCAANIGDIFASGCMAMMIAGNNTIIYVFFRANNKAIELSGMLTMSNRRDSRMKRKIILVAYIFIIMMMCSCGAEDSSSGEPAKQDTTDTEVVESVLLESQTEMCNLLCERRVYIADGWIYTYGFSLDTGLPLFLKMRQDGTDDAIFRYGDLPLYITVENGYVYAAMRNDSECNIYRYRQGGDEEVLLIPNASCFQIVGDSIYYCKTQDGYLMDSYCKSDLDGNNEEVILDKGIYLPYIVADNLYYQDDADGEKIHRYDLTTKEDVQLTKERTYHYILNDDFMYCI